MAKQALGRNLGALLGDKPKENDPASASAPQPAPVSGGVRSLIQGNRPPAAAEAEKVFLPRWYLLAGDVLLVALALIAIYKSPRPMSAWMGLFCTAVVSLGAVLAVMALFSPAPIDPEASRARAGVVPDGESPKNLRCGETNGSHPEQ
jgi:hypothetical protein